MPTLRARLSSEVLVAGLLTLVSAAPAQGQLASYLDLYLTSTSASVPDGGVARYVLEVRSRFPAPLSVTFADQFVLPVAFTPGLTYVGTSNDPEWSCQPPSGQPFVTCQFVGTLPGNGAAAPVARIDMQVSSSGAAANPCATVPKRCVAMSMNGPPPFDPVATTHVVTPGLTFWLDPAGGDFVDASNWSDGVPAAGDTAVFDLGTTYAVAMPAAASVFGGIELDDGDVTLSLPATASARIGSIAVGGTGTAIPQPTLWIVGGGEVDADDVTLLTTGGLTFGDDSRLRSRTRIDVEADSSLFVGETDAPRGAVAIGTGAYPAPGTVSIASDGVLGLRGLVIGNVANAGRMEFGSTSGTLAVAGDYAQSASGSLVALLAHDGTSVTVTPLSLWGSASFDGTIQIEAGAASVVDLQNRTVDLLYAASWSGAFASLVNHTRVFAAVDLTSYPAQLRFAGPGSCADGIDNDQDGATDFPADTSCATPWVASIEPNPPNTVVACGLGFEPALLVPLLAGVRARLRRGRLQRGR